MPWRPFGSPHRSRPQSRLDGPSVQKMTGQNKMPLHQVYPPKKKWGVFCGHRDHEGTLENPAIFAPKSLDMIEKWYSSPNCEATFQKVRHIMLPRRLVPRKHVDLKPVALPGATRRIPGHTLSKRSRVERPFCRPYDMRNRMVFLWVPDFVLTSLTSLTSVSPRNLDREKPFRPLPVAL